MKKNYHFILYGILFWCLFGANASPNKLESQSQTLFEVNNPSENLKQIINEFVFEEIEKLVIPYNSAFNYSFNLDTRWEIIDMETGSTFKNGTGSINDLLFKTPGNYMIQVTEPVNHNPDSCDHPHFPPKILLEISPVKMEFDFSTVKLSREIRGNQNLNGTTLSVDVHFSSYDGSSASYEQNFKTVGVRTSISGKLKNGAQKLQQGVNTLEFQLEGQAANDTYISIDFIDINDQIQSYRFTKKIL